MVIISASDVVCMECLSLAASAELVVSGRKTIELRTWNTRFRGRFLVHASMGTLASACTANRIDPSGLVHKAVVGSAVLYAVKEYRTRAEFLADIPMSLASPEYAHDRYGFLLKDAVRFSMPIPLSGRLGLFDTDIALPRHQGRLQATHV